MSLLTILFFALLGGVLPSILWLIFWLNEDRHPEPKKIVWKTFLFGALAVPPVLIIQWLVNNFILANQDISVIFIINYFVAVIGIGIWAFAEELFKYYAARFGGLISKYNDEPVDPMIYMITAALGFTALENTLFLVNALVHSGAEAAILTGSMRFIGATLLHVASSGIVGAFISWSYYKNKSIKRGFLIWGLGLATIVHTIFNTFVIRGEILGIFNVFGFTIVWIVIIILILIFEKVKKMKINDII